MQMKVVAAFLYILLFPALILVLGGDLAWIEAWVFGAWFLALSYGTILYLVRKDPALLEERFRRPGQGNQVGWDRYVVYGLVLGFTAWVVVMPLDARRFAWSPPFPPWLEAAGLALLLASAYLFFRSYADNPYLSALVRFQDERGQRVVSTGVYGFVRHPMYLGGVLMFVGAPLLLGSLWGIVVGLALTALLMARAVGEEALLTRELEGYREYTGRVRYRLVPRVW